MYRLSLLLMTLLLITPPSPARAQVVPGPQGVGGTSFSCETSGSGSVENPTQCHCKGVLDCSVMAKSGVCKGVAPKKDNTRCDDTSGRCDCTLGGARVGPGTDLRPVAVAPATRNAPKVRDHRTRGRAPTPSPATKPVRRDETPPPID